MSFGGENEGDALQRASTSTAVDLDLLDLILFRELASVDDDSVNGLLKSQ
jgi:hypothetical protein